MSWVRRDDQASIHRKVAPLDDATYRLWSEAIEWCSRNTTDGLIAADELAPVSLRATASRAGKLVGRGLWHQAGQSCGSSKCPAPGGPDGWVLHDYLEYQPSRDKVVADREAKAERQRRWLEAKRGASRDASHPPSGDGSKDDAPSPPRPAPKGAGAGPPSGSSADALASRRHGDEHNPGAASPKCLRCFNAVDSAYHQRVCIPSEAEPAAVTSRGDTDG